VRLFLLRHAPSNKNIQGRQGAALAAHDWRLTAKGEKEARLVAAQLQSFGPFDAVYSSPDTAAYQTATLVAQVYGLVPERLAKLQSIHLGVVSGMTDMEIAEQHPFVARQLGLYHRGFFHPRDYAIPEAETNRDFELRVREALETIVTTGGDQVCVVAHRSTITMAVNTIANGSCSTDEGYYELMHLPALSLTIIELTAVSRLNGRILAVGRPFTEDLVVQVRATTRRDTETPARNRINKHTLGISFGTHDTSACLFSGRQLRVAVEEEKLRRHKRTGVFPAESVHQCLSMKGIDISAVSTIALPASVSQYREASRLLNQSNARDEQCQREWINRVIRALEPGNILKAVAAPADAPCQIRYYRHHAAHAASAFCQSGLPSAAVMVIDGSGELDTITLFRVGRNSFECVARSSYPDSLGKLYGSLCRYLGFTGPSKEGTVMGLAAYGKPRYLSAFHSLVEWSGGLPKLDQEFFDFGLTPVHPSVVSSTFIDMFGEPREPGSPLTERHINIAASLQKFFEECVVRIGALAQTLTGEDALCYAGGVALNCLVNRQLREASLFQKLFIPPGANDAGLAIGAAYLSVYEDSISNCSNNCHSYSPFLGPSFTSDDVLKAAAGLGLSPIPISSPGAVAAHLLKRDGILGWVQGRLEFGPRALGNRSILADPRREDIRKLLNEVIKQRETFRPYAPAVLLERARRIFGCKMPSPYMLDVFDVAADWRSRIPSAVHIDGTARIQTVTAESNFLLYQVLRHFYSITGVPVVINTSFNGRDEPMVATPFDALASFARTGMPHVIVGNYLFSKTFTPENIFGVEAMQPLG
jgi:carbamoyltransferase